MFMICFGYFHDSTTRLQICPFHIFCKQSATDGTSKSKDWWNSSLFLAALIFWGQNLQSITQGKKHINYSQHISWCIKWGGGDVDFCVVKGFPLHPKGWLPPSQHHLPPADSNLWCATSTGKSWSPVPWQFSVGLHKLMGGTFPASFGGDGSHP